MRALDRKLFRDLWALRGQALAIAAVIGSGVATYVMALSTLGSLHLTREEFYREHRFADVFAALERAPDGVAERLAAIPGVERVETRILSTANLEVEGFDEPISSHVIALPLDPRGGLDLPIVMRGRAVEPGREDEVLLGEAFAGAHGIEPGDALTAVVNGRRRRLQVVGIAISPEYVFQMGPGSVFPDFERFAVLWMDREPVSRAADMEGAFNRVSIRLARGASEEDVIDRVDRVLEQYGGTGAHGREDQQSHRYLSEEFKNLARMAKIFPVIFLGVAAFLLDVVLARVVQTQREQIAALKAFGYSNLQVAVHYLKLAILVAILGALIGLAMGGWMGRGLTSMYMLYYKFPNPRFLVEARTALGGTLISCGAATLGVLFAVRRAALLPPAEAMRPEPPARYRVTWVERLGLRRWLSQPSRMILRNLARRPVKTGLSVLGISLSCAILMVSSFFWDSMQEVMFVQFRLVQREDVSVVFVEPTSRSAENELAGIPGVTRAEGFRSVAVRMHAGHKTYRTAILGLPQDGRLRRILDERLEPCALPPDGLLLTAYLAREILDVRPGDTVRVEVLEGAKRVRDVPVVGLVEEYIGVSGYMALPSLNRLMGEGEAIGGALLLIDPGAEREVYRALDARPRIAGSLARESALANFEKTMAEQMLIFAFFNTILASSIALGVVYNAARIALAERGRELASLRVLGFTRGEISWILLGELGLLTLVAIPFGFAIGLGLCAFLAWSWQIDLFRLPFAVYPRTFTFAATVVILAAAGSALIVRRRLDRLDLVAVLKTRE